MLLERLLKGRKPESDYMIKDDLREKPRKTTEEKKVDAGIPDYYNF